MIVSKKVLSSLVNRKRFGSTDSSANFESQKYDSGLGFTQWVEIYAFEDH
jgi:hypothetical protein